MGPGRRGAGPGRIRPRHDCHEQDNLHRREEPRRHGTTGNNLESPRRRPRREGALPSVLSEQRTLRHPRRVDRHRGDRHRCVQVRHGRGPDKGHGGRAADRTDHTHGRQVRPYVRWRAEPELAVCRLRGDTRSDNGGDAQCAAEAGGAEGGRILVRRPGTADSCTAQARQERCRTDAHHVR